MAINDSVKKSKTRHLYAPLKGAATERTPVAQRSLFNAAALRFGFLTAGRSARSKSGPCATTAFWLLGTAYCSPTAGNSCGAGGPGNAAQSRGGPLCPGGKNLRVRLGSSLVTVLTALPSRGRRFPGCRCRARLERNHRAQGHSN